MPKEPRAENRAGPTDASVAMHEDGSLVQHILHENNDSKEIRWGSIIWRLDKQRSEAEILWIRLKRTIKECNDGSNALAAQEWSDSRKPVA